MMDGAIAQSADSRVSGGRYGGWAVILAMVVSDGLPAPLVAIWPYQPPSSDNLTRRWPKP